MSDHGLEDFQTFAGKFVFAYWETVKSGAFRMPPDEPVEETIEELIAEVSYTTSVRLASDPNHLVYEVFMTRKSDDAWRFGFQLHPEGWVLIECSAQSISERPPVDLLGAAYAVYFAPFLRHVTDIANAK